jgi:hypothetical protein
VRKEHVGSSVAHTEFSHRVDVAAFLHHEIACRHSRRSSRLLATPAQSARHGSYYTREIDDMKQKGYTVSDDGMCLIAKKSDCDASERFFDRSI